MDEGSKKRRQRRSYTDEFRAGAMRLVLHEGKTVSRYISVASSSVRSGFAIPWGI
jgi:transposase-like protein